MRSVYNCKTNEKTRYGRNSLGEVMSIATDTVDEELAEKGCY